MQIEPGDRITIDDTLSTTYAGEYEVVSERLTLTGSTPGDGTQRSPQAGVVALTLRPYSDGNYPDTSPTSEPGWPEVPGMPGGTVTGTMFPLIDGSAEFFTGVAADGESFETPDGYSPRNLLSWASPQGHIEGDAHWHYLVDCDAAETRKCTLQYNDGSGAQWTGDVNFAGMT